MAVDPRDMDSLWVGRPFRGHMPMAVLPVHLAHALHDLRGIRTLSRVDQFLRLSILRDRLADLHQLAYNAQFILANILMASSPGFLRAESSLVEGTFTVGDSYGRKIHGDIPRDMMPVLGPGNSLEFVGLLSSSDMEKIRRYFQASPMREVFRPTVSFLEGGGKRPNPGEIGRYREEMGQRGLPLWSLESVLRRAKEIKREEFLVELESRAKDDLLALKSLSGRVLEEIESLQGDVDSILENLRRGEDVVEALRALMTKVGRLRRLLLSH